MKQLLYAAFLVTAVALLVPFAASTAYAQEADEGEDVIPNRVLLDRGVDACRQGDGPGEQYRPQRDEER